MMFETVLNPVQLTGNGIKVSFRAKPFKSRKATFNLRWLLSTDTSDDDRCFQAWHLFRQKRHNKF